MICNICKKNKAYLDPYYGYLPCKACQDRQANKVKPGGNVEFIPDYIKEDRKKNHKDIEPQHIKGKLNKKWVEQYGEKRARELGYTEKEIKSAGYVYAGSDPAYSYYKEGN